MVLLSILIILSYVFLIGAFTLGFSKIKTFNIEVAPQKNTFSVVIPFRNEAENLPDLLLSISELKYSYNLFEIVFVDDESSDASVLIIERFLEKSPLDLKIIKNNRVSNSPKKDAITSAIEHSKKEWIVTTDADCLLPKQWLNSFNEFIQKNNSICIAAPVTYYNTNSFLDRFQLLDLLSLQGSTIGGFGIKKPFMCNGANLAYKKDIFTDLNGFNGNDNIASGDDIFLMEKIITAFPDKIHYLKNKNAIVTTKPQQNWSALINQRLRWASKVSAYKSWFSKLTGLIVLLTNALIITLTLLVTLNVFNFKVFIYILTLKFSVDLLLIYKSATFFNQKKVLKTYIFAFIVYPFFSVYIVFLSLFKQYKWKDRTFKK